MSCAHDRIRATGPYTNGRGVPFECLDCGDEVWTMSLNEDERAAVELYRRSCDTLLGEDQSQLHPNRGC